MGIFARLENRGVIPPKISESVRNTIRNMNLQGFSALQKYSREFDWFELSKENIRVTPEEIESRVLLLTEKQKESIDFSFEQVFEFQKKVAQTIQPITSTTRYGTTSLIPKPMERVGIYTPGGLAALPSSLMMAGVCARAAGVKELIVCTPPRREGLNPAIAYLVKKLGIKEVYLLGGIAAIWFMANGLERISKPVDKICGPGNVYVSEAKSQLAQAGKVGIDLIAGPSEVLIIADESANACFVAADLLAQAEHGVNSSAILVTNSKELAVAVKEEVKKQLETKQKKKEIALEQCGGIFVVSNLEEGVKLANEFGPEHLEILCKGSTREKLLETQLCAGAIFIDTGEAFADYGMTGGNHILPTGGSVRFSSGLSARDFFVWQYVEQLSKEAQKELAERTATFADLENLEAHSDAARIRKR